MSIIQRTGAGDLMVAKLCTRVPLGEADRAAIRALPFVARTLPPQSYFVREGEPPADRCSFVTAGLAFRHKVTANGARQIVSLHMRADFLDLQNLFLKLSDHNVQAMTEIHLADIKRTTLQDLILTHPDIGRAMWIDALVDASMYREWMVNIGQRDARARIAHLLCEFFVRTRRAGLTDGVRCPLPMTQEQIGDAVGLTSVHVSRTLKALESEGVIEREGREIHIADWNHIKAVAQFSALYLHQDQIAPVGA